MVFYNQNSDFSPRISSHYGSQPSSVVLCTHNTGIMTRINSVYWSQTSPVILCKQSSMISARITSLHWSQTSPVVLCMPNNVISIRNTSLHGSLPSSAVFTCETATLGPELQVSIGPRPHQWCFVLKAATLVSEYFQNSDFSPRIASHYGYDLKYKSLLVPHLTHVFCIQNGDFSPRVASHYGSQPSSVVLCTHNSGIITRINSLYESHTSPMFFAFKTAPLAPELQISMGPSPHLWFFQAKQRLLHQNYKFLWVPDLTCRFVRAKQRD